VQCGKKCRIGLCGKEKGGNFDDPTADPLVGQL
jgi:hypothetical protein